MAGRSAAQPPSAASAAARPAMGVGRSTAGGLGRAVGRRKPHHWAQQQAGSTIITVCDTFPIYSSRLTAPALCLPVEGKRRLFLNRKVHEKDFARYRARVPESRDSLIATNSGSITRRDAAPAFRYCQRQRRSVLSSLTGMVKDFSKIVSFWPKAMSKLS